MMSMDPHSPEFEEHLREKLGRLPMSNEIPEEIRSKVVEEARRRQAVGPRRRLVAFGLTCAAFIAAVSIYVSAPKPAIAKSWALVQQAVDEVTRMQMTIQTNESGNDHLITVAFDKGHMAVDASGEAKIYLGDGMVQIYEPTKKHVQRIKMAEGQMEGMSAGIGSTMMQAFSLKHMLAQYEERYGKENMQISPVQTVDGKSVYYVTLKDPKHQGQALIKVDAGSDLPLEINADTVVPGVMGETREHSDKPVHAIIKLRYNEDVDSAIVAPKFGDDVKVEEIDLGNMKGFDKFGEEIGKAFGGGSHGEHAKADAAGSHV